MAAARISAVAAIVAGSCSTAARAGDDLDARIAALEKENAAIRKENALLRTNKQLQTQNSALKGSQPQPVAAPAAKSSPLAAYAADMPFATKAPPMEQHGQWRIWGEGGAIFTGGDPATQTFNLVDFTGLGGLLGVGLTPQIGTIPGSFDLTPKVGWEAATGFDYRFAASPWHISGQFRYGESKANGLAVSSGSFSAAGFGIATAGGNEAFSTAYKEKHWLADLAVGRDVIGSGPEAMQLRGGLRIAELVNTMNTADTQHRFENFPAPVLIPGAPTTITSLTADSLTTSNLRTSFLGAGPRVGIEGSVPFAGRWAFEYLGDAALLFGTEKSTLDQFQITTMNPSFLNPLRAFPGGFAFNTATQQFATLFNGDIQLGVSYWVAPNVKITGSYRLDAFIHVINESGAAANNLTPDRYIHGPRVAVTGQF
jgi:hypothetical protein